MFSDPKQPGPEPTDTTVLGQGTHWKGEINAGQHPLRIEGTVEGSIASDSSITIGPTGRVKGTILAKHLIVMGQAEGTFKIVDCLELHGAGSVEGDVETGSLVVDEGSSLQGKCTRRGFARSPNAAAVSGPGEQTGQPGAKGVRAIDTGKSGRPWAMVLGLLALVAVLAAGGFAYRKHRRTVEAVPPVASPDVPPSPSPGTLPLVAVAPEAKGGKGAGLKAPFQDGAKRGLAG